MALIKREQFIWDFFKNSKAIIPSCFEFVSFQKHQFSNKNSRTEGTLDKVIYVNLFPEFLDAKLVNEEYYSLKKIIHYGFSGSGIMINSSETVESYLGKITKQSFRVNLKRLIKKLENDCIITYEYNYGEISEEKCNLILDALYDMIHKRFTSKNKAHGFIKEWKSNTADLAELIRQKKTSLFVIYDDKKPISISVNRHIDDTIFFGETHSFDLNYRSYGLGNLNNYMRLNWCIKNKISFLDLGVGVTNHKKNWCNTFYEFEYLIYHKKNSIPAYIMASIEIFKIKVKNTIKSISSKVKNN